MSDKRGYDVNGQRLTFEDNEENQSVKVRAVDESGMVHADCTLHWSDIHPDLLPKAKCYLVKKLAQDRTSQERKEGTAVSIVEKMQDVFVQLSEGQWKKDRVGGTPTVSVKILAIHKVLSANDASIQVSDVQKLWAKYPEDKRDKILAQQAIKDAIAELEQREEVQEDALDSLLGGEAA